MVARDTMFHHPVSQSQGQRRNGVDATTCRAVVAIAVGVILGLHCRSSCGFDDAGTAWCSGR